MRILYAASEANPFAKSGGLADVAGALPKALVKDGVDARVIMPLYGDLKYRDKLEYVTNYSVPVGWRSQYCGLFKAEVDGVTYRRRTDLTTILVMGIDHDSEVEAEGSYQGGQADFQRLIVIDSKDKTVRQLKIDRDTMAEVTVLGMLGNPVGTTQMQISLAHGFGDGKEESCGYARDAVSRLLQGENIDFYLAMSLDGISVLNDLAGGVTVTLEDDFSAADPAMTKGATLTLQGDQAEIFVRRRMDIGEGTNEARMVRQEEYLAQLSAQLESRVQQDQQFTAQVYDALQPYLVTDLAKGRLVNEVWAAKDDTVEPAIALEGEHKVAEDGFTEFYPTEESIQKAVLELFWEPAEE